MSVFAQMQQEIGRLQQRIKELKEKVKDRDYAYKTIEEYQEIVGFKVNRAFEIGWDMARTTNGMFKSLIGNSEKEVE